MFLYTNSGASFLDYYLTLLVICTIPALDAQIKVVLSLQNLQGHMHLHAATQVHGALHLGQPNGQAMPSLGHWGELQPQQTWSGHGTLKGLDLLWLSLKSGVEGRTEGNAKLIPRFSDVRIGCILWLLVVANGGSHVQRRLHRNSVLTHCAPLKHCTFLSLGLMHILFINQKKSRYMRALFKSLAPPQLAQVFSLPFFNVCETNVSPW